MNCTGASALIIMVTYISRTDTLSTSRINFLLMDPFSQSRCQDFSSSCPSLALGGSEEERSLEARLDFMFCYYTMPFKSSMEPEKVLVKLNYYWKLFMISALCDPPPPQAELSKQAGRTYKQLQACKKLLCKLSNCKFKKISRELRQYGVGSVSQIISWGCIVTLRWSPVVTKINILADRLVCHLRQLSNTLPLGHNPLSQHQASGPTIVGLFPKRHVLCWRYQI